MKNVPRNFFIYSIENSTGDIGLVKGGASEFSQKIAGAIPTVAFAPTAQKRLP